MVDEENHVGTTSADRETEQGVWTKGIPKVDGDYWWRRSEHVVLGVCRVIDGEDVYIAGHVGPRYVSEESEFLGPLTASDAEELAKLRKEVKRLDGFIQEFIAEEGDDQDGQVQAARLFHGKGQ